MISGCSGFTSSTMGHAVRSRSPRFSFTVLLFVLFLLAPVVTGAKSKNSKKKEPKASDTKPPWDDFDIPATYRSHASFQTDYDSVGFSTKLDQKDIAGLNRTAVEGVLDAMKKKSVVAVALFPEDCADDCAARDVLAHVKNAFRKAKNPGDMSAKVGQLKHVVTFLATSKPDIVTFFARRGHVAEASLRTADRSLMAPTLLVSRHFDEYGDAAPRHTRELYSLAQGPHTWSEATIAAFVSAVARPLSVNTSLANEESYTGDVKKLADASQLPRLYFFATEFDADAQSLLMAAARRHAGKLVVHKQTVVLAPAEEELDLEDKKERGQKLNDDDNKIMQKYMYQRWGDLVMLAEGQDLLQKMSAIEAGNVVVFAADAYTMSLEARVDPSAEELEAMIPAFLEKVGGREAFPLSKLAKDKAKHMHRGYEEKIKQQEKEQEEWRRAQQEKARQDRANNVDLDDDDEDSAGEGEEVSDEDIKEVSDEDIKDLIKSIVAAEGEGEGEEGEGGQGSDEAGSEGESDGDGDGEGEFDDLSEEAWERLRETEAYKQLPGKAQMKMRMLEKLLRRVERTMTPPPEPPRQRAIDGEVSSEGGEEAPREGADVAHKEGGRGAPAQRREKDGVAFHRKMHGMVNKLLFHAIVAPESEVTDHDFDELESKLEAEFFNEEIQNVAAAMDSGAQDLQGVFAEIKKGKKAIKEKKAEREQGRKSEL